MSTAKKNKSKTAIDAPIKKIFLVDPDDIVVIGYDTKDGLEHPLYDPRVHQTPDEKMILNIMALGVKQAVNVRKNGNVIELVEGRRRVLAARQANKILKKQGKELVRVKVEVERGKDDEMFGIMIALNEHRRDDNPLAKAEKLKRYFDMGKTEDEAAIMFGVSTRSIKNWKKLLDLDGSVKKAVEQGKISASAAAGLADLPREEQKKQLIKLLKEATATGKKPTQRKTERSSGNVSAKTKAPGKKTIKRLLALDPDELYNAGLDEQAIKVLRWAIGDLRASSITGLSKLLTQVEKKPEPKAKVAAKKVKKPKVKKPKAKKSKAKKPKQSKGKAKKPKQSKGKRKSQKETRLKKRQAPKKKR